MIPSLLKIITGAALLLLLVAGGLLIWSMNAGDGWISTGVAAMMVLACAVPLALWAGIWHVVLLGKRGR